MNETTKKISELRSEVARIENEIRELERTNSNYYIGVCSVGNGDYWDDYYHRLGFISEEQAKCWVEKQLSGDGEYCDVWEAKYFEVTKEIYDKYYDWECLDKLYKSINRYNSAINKLEGVDSFENTVNEAIKELADEIGIEFLSFSHLG